MQNKEIKDENKKIELFTKELEVLQDKHKIRIAAVLEPSLTTLTAKIKLFTDDEINKNSKGESDGKKDKGSAKEKKEGK